MSDSNTRIRPKIRFRPTQVTTHSDGTDLYLLASHRGGYWANGREINVGLLSKHLDDAKPLDAVWSHLPSPERYDILPPDASLVRVTVRGPGAVEGGHYFRVFYMLPEDAQALEARPIVYGMKVRDIDGSVTHISASSIADVTFEFDYGGDA